MKKKTLLYAAAGLFIALAAGLWIVRSTNVVAESPESNARNLSLADIRAAGEAIVLLKSKCGFETAIERETECECDATRKLNLRVDEIEERLRNFPELLDEEVEIPNVGRLKVKSLVESRRPVDPTCPQ